MKFTKNITLGLKQDMVLLYEGKNMPLSDIFAHALHDIIGALPFSDFFEEAALIPIPGHSPMKSNTLWVPQRIAQAMHKKGIGSSVVNCLQRTIAVNKAAFSKSWNRPRAEDHYNSLSVKSMLRDFDKAVLVDDVVTTGATFMGATNKIADAMPGLQIYSFAYIRTITDPSRFDNFYKPVKGKIFLNSTGSTTRSP